MKRLLVLAPVIALLAGPALAQQTAATGDAATRQLNKTDWQFLSAASTGGLAEVDTARIAEQQAATVPVKSFAQQMIADHGKANEKLTALANQLGAAPPTEPDPKQKAAATKLKTLSGAAFDRAYIRDQVKDHKETIALFQKEVKSGQDPQLKEFASQTLPTIKHHLQMAQKIAGK